LAIFVLEITKVGENLTKLWEKKFDCGQRPARACALGLWPTTHEGRKVATLKSVWTRWSFCLPVIMTVFTLVG